MKQNEIEVGGIYSNGKDGIRRVTNEGPKFKQFEDQIDDDCVEYELLSGSDQIAWHGLSSGGHRIGYATRAKFAAWATDRMVESDLPRALVMIEASKVKLGKRATEFLLSLAGQASGEISTESTWDVPHRSFAMGHVGPWLESCHVISVHADDKGTLACLDHRGPFTLQLTAVGVEVMKRVRADAVHFSQQDDSAGDKTDVLRTRVRM